MPSIHRDIILDTSVLRRLYVTDLEDLARRGYRVHVPLYAFFELVGCHLTNREYDTSRKRYVPMFDRFHILEDPHRRLDRIKRVYLGKTTSDAVDDAEMVIQICKTIKKCGTRTELRNFPPVRFQDGTFRSLSGLPIEAPKFLKRREKRFLRFANSILGRLHTLKPEQDREKYERDMIFSLLFGEFGKTGPPEDLRKGVGFQIICKTYLYYASLFYYLKKKQVNGNRFITRNKNGLNTYEDILLMLDVSLDKHWTLVSEDKEQIEYINRAISHIKDHPELTHDPDIDFQFTAVRDFTSLPTEPGGVSR